MSNSSHPPPTRTCTLRGSTSRGCSGRCYLYRVSFHCIRVLVCPRLVGLYSYIPYEVIDMLLSLKALCIGGSNHHLVFQSHPFAPAIRFVSCISGRPQYPVGPSCLARILTWKNGGQAWLAQVSCDQYESHGPVLSVLLNVVLFFLP